MAQYLLLFLIDIVCLTGRQEPVQGSEISFSSLGWVFGVAPSLLSFWAQYTDS